ncbi:MAG TPA: hypothetical protein VHM91_10165, partial [Verrucomicrobiales bacterium]|nr:hypothetical protein [Verrucomicrobiales bacterium]
MTGSFLFLRLLPAVAALLALRSPAFGLTMTEALDAPALSWQSTLGWSATFTSQAQDGLHAAQATAVANQSEQRIGTSVTGPGLFSVSWRSLAGDEDGSLALEVDGRTVLKRNSQPFPWEQVSINVPAGFHSVSIIMRADNSDFTALVDQVAYTGSRLPAALALGDPDGLWVQTTNWQQSGGATHGGSGDFAAFQHPGGAGTLRLLRLLSEPATVKYWRKIESATPGLYTDTSGRPFTAAWTQFTVIDGGRLDQPGLVELSVLASAQAAPGLVSLDDLEIKPLTPQEAVDLPQTFTVFSVSS